MRKRRDRYLVRTACVGSATGGAKGSSGTQAAARSSAGGSYAASEPTTSSVTAPTMAQVVVSGRCGKVTAEARCHGHRWAHGGGAVSRALELPVTDRLREVRSLLQWERRPVDSTDCYRSI